MRYRIEFGQSDANRIKAQKFRQRVFRVSETGLDEDKFDEISDHCLIFDKKKDSDITVSDHAIEAAGAKCPRL